MRFTRGAIESNPYELHALGVDPADLAFVDPAEFRYRLDRLHKVAKYLGRPVHDLYVLEYFWAAEQGGPYEHGHDGPMENHQLFAHLHFAHGVRQDWAHCNIRREHQRLHDTKGEHGA